MLELTLQVDIPEHNVTVVHAGLVPGIDMVSEPLL